jgi:hypothetical protein
LSADADGKVVRRLLKRWLSEELSRSCPGHPGGVWWAEGGSVKWVWDQQYFDQALQYIKLQRATQ